MVWLVRSWSQGRSSSQQGLDFGHYLLNGDMEESGLVKKGKII